MAYKPGPAQMQSMADIRLRELGPACREPKKEGESVFDIYPTELKDDWNPWRYWPKKEEYAPNPDDPTEPPQWFIKQYEEEKAMSNNYATTKSSLAREMGVSLPTISRWMENDWFPARQDGWGWDVEAVREAAAQNRGKPGRKKSEPIKEEPKEKTLTLQDLAERAEKQEAAEEVDGEPDIDLSGNCFHCGDPSCSGSKKDGAGCETDPYWEPEELEEEEPETEDLEDGEDDDGAEDGEDEDEELVAHQVDHSGVIERLCQLYEIKVCLAQLIAVDHDIVESATGRLDHLISQAREELMG